MAAVGSTRLSLLDIAKREQGGKSATIIEMLGQYTPLVEDAMATECNDGSRHITTMRSNLTPASWAILNQGTAITKSGATQVVDTTGIIDRMSEVDTRVLKRAKDPNQQRLIEAQGQMESMAQQAETAMFLANTNTDPEQILGLLPRFNAITGASNASQIVSASGSGSDNTSIWFVTWGELACQLIYPQGSVGGVVHEDKGEQRVTDANSNPFYVMADKYEWHIGLAVRDWRSVVRICNIDVSDLTVNAATGANLMTQMKRAWWRLQGKGTATGKVCIYANSTTCEYLDHQSSLANSNTFLTYEQTGPDSPRMLSYRGIPIRRTDAILNNEATVS